MAQQITDTLSEINTLYNRKQNITELLNLIKETNIKQDNKEIIKQLMKKLPTFTDIRLMIKGNMQEITQRINYDEKIINNYKNRDLTTLNSCENELFTNGFPYISFLNDLSIIIGHANPAYFFTFIHEKIKTYIKDLITTVIIFCNLYNNEHISIGFIKDYNTMIYDLMNANCMITMIGKTSNMYNSQQTEIHIEYQYSKDTNQLTLKNWDGNTIKPVNFVSKFILNTIDLPDDYGKIIANINNLPKIKSNIQITNSQIDIEIENENNGNAFFVLPSQLNGAEYQSDQDGSIVKNIEQYASDGTGGPRGQLALHHAVGQFILDNAANTKNINGINCVKYLLQTLKTNTNNITLINGYLKVPKENEQAELFLENLDMMMVVGMEDVPVKGYYYGRETKPNFGKINKTHKVNVIYASAIPIGIYTNPYTNNNNNNNLPNIANYVMIGQYYGALHTAYKKYTNTKIKVFLMPLGGGVFNNEFIDIFNNIIIATYLLEKKYSDVNQKLDINILTYSKSYYKENEKFVNIMDNYKSK